MPLALSRNAARWNGVIDIACLGMLYHNVMQAPVGEYLKEAPDVQ